MPRDMSRYRGMYERGRRVVGPDTPTPSWVGIWTPDRASQFMPFAALKGFEDLIEREGVFIDPRREMDAERARVLDEALFGLRRGDAVAITVYSEGSGEKVIRGTVTDMAIEYGWVEVDRSKVLLGDIDGISFVSEHEQ